MDLIILFIISLLAATIFPAQSEVALTALHVTGNYNSALLIVIATSGNVLGSCINWFIGHYIEQYKHKRWFPVKQKQLENAVRIYQRYGVWSLLFAWLPIIGDPLTLIAGLLRTPFLLFLILVTIGKLLRYVALVAVF